MYGLKEKTDVDFLLGKEVTQVCFGIGQIILNLSAGVSISIESNFNFLTPNSASMQVFVNKLTQAGALVDLIGCKIQKAENKNGELKISFSTGFSLLLSDNNKNYESYVITNKNKTFIV